MCHHLAAVSPGKLFRLTVGDCRVADLLGSVTVLEFGQERTVPQAVGEMLRYRRAQDNCPVEIEAHQPPASSLHSDNSTESGWRRHRAPVQGYRAARRDRRTTSKSLLRRSRTTRGTVFPGFTVSTVTLQPVATGSWCAQPLPHRSRSASGAVIADPPAEGRH